MGPVKTLKADEKVEKKKKPTLSESISSSDRHPEMLLAYFK